MSQLFYFWKHKQRRSSFSWDVMPCHWGLVPSGETA